MSMFGGIIDTALEIISEVKMVGLQADHLNTGDTEVVDLPDAEHLNALVIKGKNGKRFRINGVQVTREV